MLSGDYGATLKPKRMALQRQDTDGMQPSLFDRVSTVEAEVRHDGAWNEARLKELTGEDRLIVRRMREDFWTFEPSHKLWISGTTGRGTWGRLRAVAPRAPDSIRGTVRGGTRISYEELARRTRPASSRGPSKGVSRGSEKGSVSPRRCSEATAEYRERENVVGQFVEEACKATRRATLLTTADLYSAFEKWCEQSGKRR